MSRSKRKTPVVGITTARSNKPFKVDEHRAERRTVRTILASGMAESIPHPKVFGNEWNSPRDGKQMVDPKSRWMRK